MNAGITQICDCWSEDWEIRPGKAGMINIRPTTSLLEYQVLIKGNLWCRVNRRHAHLGTFVMFMPNCLNAKIQRFYQRAFTTTSSPKRLNYGVHSNSQLNYCESNITPSRSCRSVKTITRLILCNPHFPRQSCGFYDGRIIQRSKWYYKPN